MKNGEILKRLCTDEEFDQTFTIPTARAAQREERRARGSVPPKLKPEETIAQRREKRIAKKPVKLNL